MLAYTGFETVANLAAEIRGAGEDAAAEPLCRDRQGTRSGIYVLIAFVGMSAYPPPNDRSELRSGTTGRARRSSGSSSALQLHLPDWFVRHPPRLRRRDRRARSWWRSTTTSISGFGRLAYSLGEHGKLPTTSESAPATLVPPASVVPPLVIAIALIIGTSFTSVTFLASLFSFGVLLAFTAAQLAVIRLRRTKPDLREAVPRAARGSGCAEW